MFDLTFTTVIVPIDPDGFGNPAVAPALQLAESFEAEITLVGEPGVVEPYRRSFWSAGDRVSHRYVRPGEEPGAAVADAGTDHEHTLVVIATHARGRLGYALAHSTAADIVRTSGDKVLLIGPHCEPGWKPGSGPAVVALDGSELAEQALPVAAGWADHFGVDLDLAQVVTRSQPAAPGAVLAQPAEPVIGAEPVLGLARPVAPEPASAPEPRLADVADTYLAGHANVLRNQGLEVRTHVPRARNPAKALAELTAGHGANVAVLTTHARAGLSRVALGSTTIALARRAPVPVLTTAPVRDDGAASDS